MKSHFWQGTWIDEQELNDKIEKLNDSILRGYEVKFNIEEFYRSCHRFSIRLRKDSELRKILAQSLVTAGEASEIDAHEIINEVADFLIEEDLRHKLKCEFGTDNPFRSSRISGKTSTFESWFPLGFVVQILASNSPSLAVLSGFEGLLTGNINFIKLSRHSSNFTGLIFDNFFQDSKTQIWKNLMIIGKIPSHQKNVLQKIMQEADGIVAWGGEEALAQIRSMAPTRARLIEWGHRISFSYLTLKEAHDETVLRAVAKDVFRFDQQACSSPQCVFVEDANFAQLQNIAVSLGQQFEAESQGKILAEPSEQEFAEINRVVQVALAEKSLYKDFSAVIKSPDNKWRILVDSRSGLTASPLYRTIWLKTITRNKIVQMLRPLGQYLQSVGLSCDRSELSELSEKFYQAGVTRIRPSGRMLDSYAGEPHDGVPALTRYMKKVSLEQTKNLESYASLDDLNEQKLEFFNWPNKIMTKEDFQNQSSEVVAAELYFKSGGSSGESKSSIFTYLDYHRQMRLAADGLLAAGLDPMKDRCMNLFFGGGLYGGFLSFFTILEDLKAVQFPMSAHLDFEFVGQTIVKYDVNVLLGMPSYLLQLFETNSELFKKHKKVNKIFFGGEHFSNTQRNKLKNEFGVNTILSASYGSVDMGPLGYQCTNCTPSVHHLHQHLHFLEILKLDSDFSVDNGEVGRLVFSTHGRKGQNLLRYDIGDIGKWVNDLCLCGRKSPRFELMGRAGDIFRAAGSFFNYNLFNKILSDKFNYSWEFQLIIDNNQSTDRIVLKLDRLCEISENELFECLTANYSDLRELVTQEKSLRLEVQKVESANFERSAGSGKLLRVIDKRNL